MSGRDPDSKLDALRKEDALTRLHVQKCFTEPLVVEAGAGTGKTSILVARIVAWCLGQGWARAEEEDCPAEDTAGQVAEGVVAITFTEAAAAEMATRVGEALREIANGGCPVGVECTCLPEGEIAATRAVALLTQLHRLRTSTIHSFCQWILGRYPVEAGLAPSFKVDADGVQVEKVAREAVENALRLGDAGETWLQWKRLAGEGITPQRVVSVLAKLINSDVRPSDLDRDPFAPASVAASEAELRESVASFRSLDRGRLSGLTRSSIGRKVADRVTSLHERLDAGELDGGAAFEQLRGIVGDEDEYLLAKLSAWARGDLSTPVCEVIEEHEGEELAGLSGRIHLELLMLSEARPEELAAARKVLAGLLVEAREAMRRQGIVTFSDLLRCARDVLSSSEELRHDVRRGISQLLVDEFQDTDTVQCDMVAMLALGGGDPSARPGLFIVGDPKQSIYGWRDADLAAYHDFVDNVVREGGSKLKLSVNFRSVPAVLDEVERAVAPVMHPEKGLQPPFEKLAPSEDRRDSSGFVEGERAAVEYWVSRPPGADGVLDPGPKLAPALTFEAEAVAEDIVSLHREHGVAWSAVGILLRRISHLDLVLQALRRAGVPYEVARDREYYRQREVVEAAALVRAIIDPGDQIALLTVLRSEVVGVPDSALLPLWRRGLPSMLMNLHEPQAELLEEAAALVGDVAAEVGSAAPGMARLGRWPSALLAAIECLAVLRQSLDVDPPEIFVERLRTLWLAEISAAARYLGAHRVARLEGFFQLVETALVDGEGGLAQVARGLQQAVAREQEAQQVMRPAQASDAVQIMTIHGAKGLDFAHVYVLQTFAGTQSGGGRQSADATVHRGAAGLEYRLFGWPTPGFAEMEAHNKLRERAELVRLLYVTCTRAKDRLVFSGSWPEKRLPLPSSKAACLGDLVVGRWDSGEMEAQEEAGESMRLEANRQTAWMLPGLRPLGQVKPWREEGSGVTVDLESRQAQWAWLAGEREKARERMQRALTGGASAAAHLEIEERGAEEEGDRPPSGTPGAVAAVVGTLVHRLFEELDLGADLGTQLESGVARAVERLRRELDGEDARAAEDRVNELNESLENGRCLARLEQIGGTHVVARELPMVLPPNPDRGPVGAVAGFADLVYCDPESGELVVADYKTDRIAPGAGMDDRAEGYRPQLELYAEGIQSAFGLRQRPGMELWFLHADAIVRL